jgi:pimeloyl-ACP methyl ester carboxylesterase
VEDVVDLIELMGEESAFLAGVSQGGAVFSRVALAYPHRVRGLVNMCGGPGAPPPEALARLAALAEILGGDGDDQDRRHAAEDFAREYFHGPGFLEREPSTGAAEIDVMLNHRREALPLLAALPGSYESITERLGEITSPVLVIWGEEDPRPTLGAEVAAAIPGARLVVVQGAGHHVNVDAPDEVSRAIQRFLRDATRAPYGPQGRRRGLPPSEPPTGQDCV